MTKFLNLKILVENNLDEIISTLESKGYRCDGYYPYYCNYIGRGVEYILTTIAEIKEI